MYVFISNISPFLQYCITHILLRPWSLREKDCSVHLNANSDVLARHTHHHFLIFSYFIVPTSLSSGLHPRSFPCVSITGNLFSLQNALYKCLMGFGFCDFFLHCQRSYFLPFLVYNLFCYCLFLLPTTIPFLIFLKVF